MEVGSLSGHFLAKDFRNLPCQDYWSEKPIFSKNNWVWWTNASIAKPACGFLNTRIIHEDSVEKFIQLINTNFLLRMICNPHYTCVVLSIYRWSQVEESEGYIRCEIRGCTNSMNIPLFTKCAQL
jgi:hypothetical protein